MKKMYIISAIAALLCGILVLGYVKSNDEKIEKLKQSQKYEMVNVVVANTDIPPFTEITADMVALKEFPKAYTDPNAATAKDQVVGLQANGTIAAGEQIFTTVVGKLENIGDSLAYEIPDGMRAMTINVGDSSGLGGYISAGDLVDVMLSVSTETRDKITDSDSSVRDVDGAVITVITQAAKVLRVGNRGYDPNGSNLYTSLTLALSPADCIKLYGALEEGSIYVVLRQVGDDSPADTLNYNMTKLLRD